MSTRFTIARNGERPQIACTLAHYSWESTREMLRVEPTYLPGETIQPDVRVRPGILTHRVQLGLIGAPDVNEWLRAAQLDAEELEFMVIKSPFLQFGVSRWRCRITAILEAPAGATEVELYFWSPSP